MDRAPGLSVRLKLTLSYAGFLMIAGALLLATVWVFLLRYVPDHARFGPGPSSPTRSDLLDAFAPRAAQALAFLLVLGLVGGWFLAGRMLAPLTRITNATRKAATGSLSHRIELEGRQDEFRDLADSSTPCSPAWRRTSPNSSGSRPTPPMSCVRRSAVTGRYLDLARKDPTRDPGAWSTASKTSTPGRSTSPKHCSCSATRISGPSHENQVDLSLIAEEATETLWPLAEKQGVTIETAGDSPRRSGRPRSCGR